MTIHDIQYVTKSVLALIEQAFKIAGVSSGNKVFPEPPSRIGSGKDGVGFFLYHVQENAYYKNLPPLGKDDAGTRFTPMALNLYYQLSANHSTDDNHEGTFDEQMMMSVAMKALHDYPEITDKTILDRDAEQRLIMESAIRNNDVKFKITLQPLSYTEAIQFWTAGTSPSHIKLSAYYEVSVIFLEPEQVQSMAGRVLAYGVNVFTEGAPQIIGSQNIIEFTDPLTNGIKKLNAQPAQVAVGDTLSFLGTGFNGIQDVVITNAHWQEPVIIPINDANWQAKLTGSDTLSLKIFDTRDVIEETPLPRHLIQKKILPGMYAAQIRVTRKFKLPNGDERAVEHLSNQFPFIVTPKTVSTPLAGGKITITGGVFKDTDLPDTAVQVYVGNQRYIKNSSGDRGTFDIVDSATLNLTLENGLESGKYLPLRVIISGAESAPNWITVP